jgi:hypothetical protein
MTETQQISIYTKVHIHSQIHSYIQEQCVFLSTLQLLSSLNLNVLLLNSFRVTKSDQEFEKLRLKDKINNIKQKLTQIYR